MFAQILEHSQPVGETTSLPLESFSDAWADRLADAARYVVLSRLMPVLRHEVAGAMQAPRMLLMVVEKRLQALEPDLQAITKNVASISAQTKQASVTCMAAMDWIASREDIRIDLFSSVDEMTALLAMELSVHALTVVNSIEDTQTTVPQSFIRSVVVGALLAFCDQHPEGGSLQVTFKPANSKSGLSGQLRLQLRSDAAVKLPETKQLAPASRLIDWMDLQAMAQSTNVQMARGEGWLTLDLP